MEEVRARRKCAVVHKPCRALVAMERSSHYPKGNKYKAIGEFEAGRVTLLLNFYLFLFFS